MDLGGFAYGSRRIVSQAHMATPQSRRAEIALMTDAMGVRSEVLGKDRHRAIQSSIDLGEFTHESRRIYSRISANSRMYG